MRFYFRSLLAGLLLSIIIGTADAARWVGGSQAAHGETGVNPNSVTTADENEAVRAFFVKVQQQSMSRP